MKRKNIGRLNDEDSRRRRKSDVKLKRKNVDWRNDAYWRRNARRQNNESWNLRRHQDVERKMKSGPNDNDLRNKKEYGLNTSSQKSAYSTN